MDTKTAKTTQITTAAHLVAARRELGQTQTGMAQILRMSRPGYVRLERGQRRISGPFAVAVELLLERDRRFMQRLREEGVFG